MLPPGHSAKDPFSHTVLQVKASLPITESLKMLHLRLTQMSSLWATGFISGRAHSNFLVTIALHVMTESSLEIKFCWYKEPLNSWSFLPWVWAVSKPLTKNKPRLQNKNRAHAVPRSQEHTLQHLASLLFLILIFFTVLNFVIQGLPLLYKPTLHSQQSSCLSFSIVGTGGMYEPPHSAHKCSSGKNEARASEIQGLLLHLKFQANLGYLKCCFFFKK